MWEQKHTKSAFISQLHSPWLSRFTQHSPMCSYGTTSLRHLHYFTKFSCQANSLKKGHSRFKHCSSSIFGCMHIQAHTHKCMKRNQTLLSENMALSKLSSVMNSVPIFKTKRLNPKKPQHVCTLEHKSLIPPQALLSLFCNKFLMKSLLKKFPYYLFLLVYMCALFTQNNMWIEEL